MPIPTALHVKHTVTYQAKPLVCFSNLPGCDAEMTPTQIRQLAAAMLNAADDCETLQDTTRRHIPVRREYSLNTACLKAARCPAMSQFDSAGFRCDAPIWGIAPSELRSRIKGPVFGPLPVPLQQTHQSACSSGCVRCACTQADLQAHPGAASDAADDACQCSHSPQVHRPDPA